MSPAEHLHECCQCAIVSPFYYGNYSGSGVFAGVQHFFKLLRASSIFLYPPILLYEPFWVCPGPGLSMTRRQQRIYSSVANAPFPATPAVTIGIGGLGPNTSSSCFERPVSSCITPLALYKPCPVQDTPKTAYTVILECYKKIQDARSSLKKCWAPANAPDAE